MPARSISPTSPYKAQGSISVRWAMGIIMMTNGKLWMMKDNWGFSGYMSYSWNVKVSTEAPKFKTIAEDSLMTVVHPPATGATIPLSYLLAEILTFDNSNCEQVRKE